MSTVRGSRVGDRREINVGRSRRVLLAMSVVAAVVSTNVGIWTHRPIDFVGSPDALDGTSSVQQLFAEEKAILTTRVCLEHAPGIGSVGGCACTTHVWIGVHGGQHAHNTPGSSHNARDGYPRTLDGRRQHA